MAGVATLQLCILMVIVLGVDVDASLTDAQKRELLDAHNTLRRSVRPPAKNMKTMKWSSGLENIAQAYANKCIWKHNPNRKSSAFSYVGENLYTTTGSISNYGDVVRSWYDEAKYYHYSTNTCDSSKVCGHYTQVVWATSDNLGCGVARCSRLDGLGASYKNALFVVCDYGPGGNIVGEKPYISSGRRPAELGSMTDIDDIDLLKEAGTFDENHEVLETP